MKNILFLLILLTGFFASSAVQTQLADKVIIGRASSADKTIGFNHDLLVHSPSDPLSMLNPSIKLNRLTGTLQTSNNGADFRNLNVYSGIGETNLLENSGFEMYREFSTSGTPSGFYGWLGPGSGIWPITSGSNVLTDSKSLRFNGTSSGEYLYSSQYAIPKRLYGRECLAKINYTTGAAGAAAKVYLEVYDGSGLFVAGPSALSEATSTPKELKLNFTCPSSGTIGLRVTSAGNSLYHYLDDAFLGEAATAKSPASPTIQRFTSGSGTYTTPINVKYIKVKMVGGGGGAAGTGTAGQVAGGAGGTTTFGTSLLTANGGAGGLNTAPNNGGAGGAVTINSPAVSLVAIIGGAGQSASGVLGSNIMGPNGAASFFGGAGAGETGSRVGGSAAANSGSGGGGSGSNGTVISGPAGGAGGYLEAIINSPSATYSYAVGAGGTGGAAGTSGAAGGAGGSGVIIVEEYY